MAKQLRIAVVGPGLVGATHARLINESDDLILSAVVSTSGDTTFEVAPGKKVPNFRTVSDLIASLPIDGAIVSSPTEFHFVHATELIKAKIPVLIEKPVGTGLDQIQKLKIASQRHCIPVCVGHHRVHGRLFQVLEQLLRSESLGKCHFALAKTIFKKPPDYFKARKWRTKPENLGVVGINAIHDIDLMQRLFGPFSSVYAELDFDPTIDRLPTMGKVICKSNESSCVFLFSDKTGCSDSWEQTAGENNYFRKHSGHCYEFFCENGSLRFPGFRISSSEGGLDWQDEIPQKSLIVLPDDPLKNQIQHFRRVILGHEKPKVTLSDSIRNRRVVDAIFESASNMELVFVECDDER